MLIGSCMIEEGRCVWIKIIKRNDCQNEEIIVSFFAGQSDKVERQKKYKMELNVIKI